jgi:acyl transferase domain-containing protein/NADPH:quinone reductase-like Zn-dependent oxidoreductase/acyl carrier protein
MDRRFDSQSKSPAKDDREPIAVIGLGCRFPGSPNAEAFWQLLVEGRDAVGPMPSDRFDTSVFDDSEPGAPGMIATRRGGFLNDIDQFDAAFFGIAPREAHVIDPQHRLLLETTVEALEDAGVPRPRLAGSRSGVFVGVWTNDYERLVAPPSADIDVFAATGTGRYAAAGRISYAFDLRGPSLAIDTACSSSLVAVHLACQSLKARECDLAIVGAVNLILDPLVSIAYTRSGLLSTGGNCRFGNAQADGYVRSEGVGVLILRRMSSAVREGDRIRALIAGSAVNNDGGGSGSLMAPSSSGQAEMLREAYRMAGIGPHTVQYVEAHGTGTRVGDPVEINAIAEVVGSNRASGKPCLVGSVKTNIGHTESAAGMAGLIKVVLGLENDLIPPTRLTGELNPEIDWDRLAVKLCTEPAAWQNDSPPTAGVSAFGITGTNAHVILQQAPSSQKSVEPLGAARPSRLVLLSGQTAAALNGVASRWRERSWDESEFADAVYTAAVRRTHYSQRLAVVADSFKELRNELGRRLEEGLATRSTPPPSVVFVFPGQGSQWLGMGRQLLESEPIARETLTACDEVIKRLNGFSVLDVVRRADARDFEDIGIVQPLLFAIQITLARLWISWGIVPAACIGHSMGELAAAHIAGVLSLEDAARVICARSALLRHKRGQGAMALIETTQAEAENLLAPFVGRLSVAVVNSDRSTVVSGDPDALSQLLASLEERGTFCRPVKVDVASHSPQMDDLLAPLTDALKALHAVPGTCPIYSTVSGDVLDGSRFDAAYWAHNLRDPVQFAKACRGALRDGHGAFVEISPHPLLVPSLRQIVGEGANNPTVVPSLRRDSDERRVMLQSLGELYEAGCVIDWRAHYERPQTLVSLPSYPWQRERFWADYRETHAERSKASRNRNSLLAGEDGAAPADLVGRQYWTTYISTATHPMLADHRVAGQPVAPAALFATLALEALAAQGVEAAHLDNLTVHEALTLDETGHEVQVVADRPDGRQTTLRIYSQRPDQKLGAWTLHFTATDSEQIEGGPSAQPFERDVFSSPTLTGDEVYETLRKRRLEYGRTFRRIAAAGQRDGMWWTRIPPDRQQAAASRWASRVSALDACLQAVALSLDATAEGTWLPVEVRSLRVFEWPKDDEIVCRVRSRNEDTDQKDRYVADLAVFTLEGRPLVLAEAVVLARLGQESVDGLLYHLVWEQFAPESELRLSDAPVSNSWIVLDDLSGAGLALVPEAERGSVTRFVPGQGAELERALSSVPADAKTTLHIVHGWNLDLAVDGTPETFARAREAGLVSVLRAARALSGRQVPTRLVVVTRGAQNVDESSTVAFGQTPVWGLTSVLRAEHPEITCITLDLDPAGHSDVARLSKAIVALAGSDDIAERNGQLFRRRLRTLGPASNRSVPARQRRTAERFRFFAGQPGLLDSIEPAPLPDSETKVQDVEIEIDRAGLNFMNVMSGLGIYPGYDAGSGPLGIECVGRVTKCGARVAEVQVGDRVVAFAFDCLASHVATNAQLVAPVPDRLSDDQAATIPIAFVTAYYSLIELARLQSGDRILIHSAAGGVGLAAVQIARLVGAEVFATAGTNEKREYLRGLGIEHVFDSRTTQFAKNVREVTGGEGVDVVLNSLAGEAIDAGLSVLRSGGRFVELGKRDIYQNRSVGLGAFRANVSYHAVDLDRMARERPSVVGHALQKVMALAAQGRIDPLPYKIFPATRVVDAFREMASGRHIGKLVIDVTETHGLMVRPQGSPDWSLGTYLITGGLGALGLTVAEWLVDRGARSLVLAGRRAPGAATRQVIAALEIRGAAVLIEQADVARRDDVSRLLQKARGLSKPLRGVFHAAGVLDDSLLEHLDSRQLQSAMAPKAEGAWHLHDLTRGDQLDAFVLFSSVSGFLGSAGQGNYAAANAFLDGLAHHRHLSGLPALSVQWGPWAGIGLAAREEGRGARLAAFGLGSLSQDEGRAVLESLLARGESVAAAMRFDADRWRERAPGAAQNHLLDGLGEAILSSAPSERSDLLSELQAAPTATAKRGLVERHVRAAVSRVVRTNAERIDLNASLRSLGLDSLMTLELRNLLERDTGLRLASSLVWNHPTVKDLASHLLERLADTSTEPAPHKSVGLDSGDDPLEAALREIESLSDDEVRQLLAVEGDSLGEQRA